MKSCTDREQGRMLAEILPKESSDMYACRDTHWLRLWERKFGNHQDVAFTRGAYGKENVVPIWSLAALLEVIPNVVVENFVDKTYVVSAHKEIDGVGYAYLGGADADNPVDACVELIEKLHKEGVI